MSELPGITEVDFVPIPSEDLDRSVAFYRDVLGLDLTVHMPERNFAEFDTDNVMINIAVYSEMGMTFAPNPNPLALRVTDVAAAREDLEAKGIEFMGPTVDTGVCHMAFFKDPDENALMLHHRHVPRSTAKAGGD
ncbi:MAG: VOC family protein [Actinomycetes bacterium]